MKKIMILAMICGLFLLTACSPQPLQTIGAAKYYVKIDNDGEEYTEFNDTRYAYDLVAYDEAGQTKELHFTAGHQLRRDAYLMIYYKKEEVITYKEVTSEDIPKELEALLNEEI